MVTGHLPLNFKFILMQSICNFGMEVGSPWPHQNLGANVISPLLVVGFWLIMLNCLYFRCTVVHCEECFWGTSVFVVDVSNFILSPSCSAISEIIGSKFFTDRQIL